MLHHVLPRKTPGLSGSPRRTSENLSNSGPLKPIGHQPLFGSTGTSATSGVAIGGISGACSAAVSGIFSGAASGGDNDPRCTGNPAEMNNCFGGGPLADGSNQPSGPSCSADCCPSDNGNGRNS